LLPFEFLALFFLGLVAFAIGVSSCLGLVARHDFRLGQNKRRDNARTESKKLDNTYILTGSPRRAKSAWT
jgi:hypothetical protein